MSEQQQKEYIITEELRARMIKTMADTGLVNLAVRLMDESHPHTPAPAAEHELCPYWESPIGDHGKGTCQFDGGDCRYPDNPDEWGGCNRIERHDAAIRNDERERVCPLHDKQPNVLYTNIDLSKGDPEYIVKGSELVQLTFHHIHDNLIMLLETEIRKREIKSQPHTSAPVSCWQFKEMKTLHDKECFMAGYREGTNKSREDIVSAINNIKKFIQENSWEEEFLRYTGDCHPQTERVIYSDVIIELLDESQHGKQEQL